MADIIVRVPKAEVEHFWNPIGSDMEAWWTLSRKPKSCGVGDVIWFEIDGEVVARAPITFVDENLRECEETGRTWKGVHIGWKGGTLERLDKPREGTGITRGFRYYDP